MVALTVLVNLHNTAHTHLWKTHKILCLVTMDKRMTGRKSVILEKACFQKGLQFLFEKGIHVVEVVTDAHVQIEALMSKCFRKFIF